MSEKELQASRYIENFNPQAFIDEGVHQVCVSIADAFLGQIEYGKDYVISTNLFKTDWANGFGTKYTYNLKFDEVVRCRDCVNASFDEFGGGWCNENCREIKPWDFCAWGERKVVVE